MAALLGALGVVGIGIVSACGGGGGGGCQEDWTAGNRPEHSGCTAGPINPGYITYQGSTLWRHHNAPYTKTADSDVDCRRNPNCTFTDVAEDTFVCQWWIQVWDTSISDFVDAGPFYGNCNCSGGNWTTAPDDDHYEPGREYRAKCIVNDTVADGPYGDDAAQARYSAGQVLWAPTPDNFQLSQGYPQCNQQDGTLSYFFTWTSSCGHLAHLDKVTVRERVTYEPAFTSAGAHDTSHSGANCFTQFFPDPTYGRDKPGTNGYMGDDHTEPTMSGAWTSYCQGAQKYQWATGWKYRPERWDDTADWQDFPNQSYTIRRYVENRGTEQNPDWWYHITKDGGDCDHDL
jgi:hypothetical protein